MSEESGYIEVDGEHYLYLPDQSDPELKGWEITVEYGPFLGGSWWQARSDRRKLHDSSWPRLHRRIQEINDQAPES